MSDGHGMQKVEVQYYPRWGIQGHILQIWYGDGAIFIGKIDNGCITPDLTAGSVIRPGCLQIPADGQAYV